MKQKSAKKRLLLIGWDSADWKLIQPLVDQGAMKGLEHLLQTGVSGTMTTLDPQLSPMLWTSIATGKHAYHHGVPGFTEVDPVSGQVVPVSAATRQCRTVWEILNECGLKTHVVSWFATQGERDLNGCMVSNMFSHFKSGRDQDPSEWPAPMPGTYWPDDLAAVMNELRVSPWDLEESGLLRLFVPQAESVDQQRDKRLWNLAEKMAEAYSVQAAATHLMETNPDWDFMAVYFRAIDEISHLFMHYHPPRMDGIPERDFELYREVVAGAYRAHDLMLQHLIAQAGADTAIMLVSDHGFHSDHLRPKFTPRVPAGITVWHRPQGVFAVAGPGFGKDELIYGARLLDVTPTILAWFGLPVGEDMEGRVLREAFESPPEVKMIPTWEGAEKKQHDRLSAGDNKALLDQFAALGYIDEVSGDAGEAAAETNRENKWNLARACMNGEKYEQALPLLEDCFEAIPERTDYAQALSRCQLRLGLVAEAEETISVALESFGRTEAAFIVRANIALEKGDHAEALRQLRIVEEKNPAEPQLLLPLARTCLELRRWSEADAAARRILESDPYDDQALTILARIALHQGDAEAASGFALEAIGYQFGNARAHFFLGTALVRLQDWGNAETALRNAIKLNPSFIPAYRFLGQVFSAGGRQDEASLCKIQSQTMRAKAESEERERSGRLRGEVAMRAEERRTARHKAREEKKRQDAETAAVPPMEFVIVSGLPRSGTSLMMQMLQAGGMELMTDGERTADEDNPEGYWEWEAVKTLPRNPRILEKAGGRAVKVISALLPHLPPGHSYRILFMRRPVTEVVRSQWKMIARRGGEPRSEQDHLIATQERHVETMLETLRRSPRVQLLEIDYPGLVGQPQDWLSRIAAFVGEQSLPHAGKMTSVIRADLYRMREGGAVAT